MKKLQKNTLILTVLLALVLSGCGGTAGDAAVQGAATEVPPATTARPVVTQPADAPETGAQPQTAPQGVPAIEATPGVDKFGPLSVTEPVGRVTPAELSGDAPRISRDPTETGPEQLFTEPFQTWCMFAGTGATMGIDGERLNFTCSQTGDVTVGLFGEIQPQADGWMVARKSFKPGADGFVGLLSEMTRIEAVLLHDGMRCQWAGDAPPACDGKRVNFTCQSETGAEYVLVGDVVLGDEGWTIERGVLVRSAAAVKLEKVAPILIDALGVRK